MEPLTLHLHDRRRKRLAVFESLQQALAAVLLLFDVGERLRGPVTADFLFAAVRGLTGILLIVMVLRHLRGKPSGRLGWVDLAAGIMLALQWADARAHGGKLFSPVLLMALISLTLGIFHVRIDRWKEQRVRLHLDDQRLDFRLSRLRRFRVPWIEVTELVREPTAIHLVSRDGRRYTLPLSRLEEEDQVAEAVLAYAQAAGIATTGGGMGGMGRTEQPG